MHYSSSAATPTDRNPCRSCIPHGLGPYQNDEDPDVQLPEMTPVDNVGIDLADGSKVPIFRLLCILSTIRHEIFKSLYSS